MKRYIIRLATLLSALPVPGMVIAHPGHENTVATSQHFVGVDNLTAMVVLVLVIGGCWIFVRRQ